MNNKGGDEPAIIVALYFIRNGQEKQGRMKMRNYMKEYREALDERSLFECGSEKWNAVDEMKRIRKLYEYKDERYSIIVPADVFDIVKDSTFLGHCVANTNRYYERISSEESYIVFLRQTDKPNRPWYTLEIEPGGTIRQKRSYSNEQYSDLQEAVPFLKEWQQVVQKRMDEKERKLAVESKEKRNKEFEKLTVNGNIIHTGRYAGKLLVDELMKDLMEAAATA